MPTKTELAYAAALIDGEGCIFVGFTFAYGGTYKKKKYRRSFLCVNIATTDDVLPQWMHRRFGGSIYKRKKLYGFQTSYQRAWTLTGKSAGEFLQAVLPYLVLKKAQAKLAIRFQLARNNDKELYRGRYSPVPERRWQYYQRLAAKIKSLKLVNQRRNASRASSVGTG